MIEDRRQLRDRYAQLSYLLAAYFHQDWGDFADTVDEVLADFTQSEQEATATGAADDATRLLTVAHEDEDELRRVLGLLGGEVFPPGVGFTYCQFFERIAALASR